ncbi:hypothetical protein HQ714_01705 [Enterococcus faecium]|nr:hypothetical protein [Enterococcus faecium]
MEQFLNEKITEAKREIDRLTHVCQTKPFDSADFFENEFQIERLAAQIEVYELILKKVIEENIDVQYKQVKRQLPDTVNRHLA